MSSANTAYAHEVAIEGDVGATLHIEPNDTPQAGEEVLAWFALTRPGGETIPLANCNCTLAVYSQPKDRPYEGVTPTLTPELLAVDAEGYQDIPGAKLTFPEVGTYTMVIGGTPKQTGDFTPFTLSFEKTIASEIPKVPKREEETLPSPEVSLNSTSATVERPNSQRDYGRWVAIGIAIPTVVGAFAWVGSRLLQRSK